MSRNRFFFNPTKGHMLKLMAASEAASISNVFSSSFFSALGEGEGEDQALRCLHYHSRLRIIPGVLQHMGGWRRGTRIT
jgi:hypothetical protein